MQQRISVITLGVSSLGRTRAFHVRGSGRSPVFKNGEIVFYQMNGFMLGTWRNPQLDKDTQRASAPTPSAYPLAHNVPSQSDVGPTIARPVAAGGKFLRAPDDPRHGGFRGYLSDPDRHAWETALNPAWRSDERGLVTVGT